MAHPGPQSEQVGVRATLPAPTCAVRKQWLVLLSGWEASQLIPLMRTCRRSFRARSTPPFSVQLGHLADPGIAMTVSAWGQPKFICPAWRAVLRLLNGDTCFANRERRALARFLGIAERSNLVECVGVCREEWQSQYVWDALRDMQVLTANGFVSRLPSKEELRPAVAAARADWLKLDRKADGQHMHSVKVGRK